MHQCLKFILFWNDPLHVSEVFPSIIRISRMYIQQHAFVKTDTADCLLASRQQYLFDMCLLQYVKSLTPGDGRKDRPKHAECYSTKINLRFWCIWFVLLQKLSLTFVVLRDVKQKELEQAKHVLMNGVHRPKISNYSNCGTLRQYLFKIMRNIAYV